MMYNTRDYWVFGFCPSSGTLKNTTIRKLICFRFQVMECEIPAPLGPLEKAGD
jgi:hypothetical protein